MLHTHNIAVKASTKQLFLLLIIVNNCHTLFCIPTVMLEWFVSSANIHKALAGELIEEQMIETIYRRKFLIVILMRT